MPSLKIVPVPYDQTFLSHPISPSPPIQPTNPQQKHSIPLHPIPTSTPPPPTPLHWLWQCHICQQRYPLSATRRCLEDGHFFCAGVTVMRKRLNDSRKARAVVKRHVP